MLNYANLNFKCFDGKSHKKKLPEALQKAKELCDEFTVDVRNCGITSIDGYGSKASNVRTLDVSFNRLSDLTSWKV